VDVSTKSAGLSNIATGREDATLKVVDVGTAPSPVPCARSLVIIGSPYPWPKVLNGAP
jgi:hypothetical protein